MASGVNKAIIIGRLGNDPEVRYTANGGAVGNFNLATNESWTDKAGQKQERTEWHRIVVWGKMAELCGQYLSKGRQAYVEGRLQTREWTDKEGVKKYTTEIVAQSIQFLGSSGEKGASPSSDFAPPASDFGGSFGFDEKGGAPGGGVAASNDEVPF